MRNRWWIALELNYIVLPFGNSRDEKFKRWPSFIAKNKMFAMDKIANNIYDVNFSFASY